MGIRLIERRSTFRRRNRSEHYIVLELHMPCPPRAATTFLSTSLPLSMTLGVGQSTNTLSWVISVRYYLRFYAMAADWPRSDLDWTWGTSDLELTNLCEPTEILPVYCPSCPPIFAPNRGGEGNQEPQMAPFGQSKSSRESDAMVAVTGRQPESEGSHQPAISMVAV
jgi:hypothetical protein